MKKKFRKVYHPPKKKKKKMGKWGRSPPLTLWVPPHGNILFAHQYKKLPSYREEGRRKREPELVKEYENHYCELFYRTIMNDPLQDVEHHRRILAKAFRLIIDQISEEERDNFIPLIVSSLNCRVFVVCNLNIIYVIFIPRVIFKS